MGVFSNQDSVGKECTTCQHREMSMVHQLTIDAVG